MGSGKPVSHVKNGDIANVHRECWIHLDIMFVHSIDFWMSGYSHCTRVNLAARLVNGLIVSKYYGGVRCAVMFVLFLGDGYRYCGGFEYAFILFVHTCF